MPLSLLGVSTGIVAINFCILYIVNNNGVEVFKFPFLLIGLSTILLYFISYIWLRAWRGDVDSDPISFALKDLTCILLGVAAIALMLIARLT